MIIIKDTTYHWYSSELATTQIKIVSTINSCPLYPSFNFIQQRSSRVTL